MAPGKAALIRSSGTTRTKDGPALEKIQINTAGGDRDGKLFNVGSNVFEISNSDLMRKLHYKDRHPVV